MLLHRRSCKCFCEPGGPSQGSSNSLPGSRRSADHDSTPERCGKVERLRLADGIPMVAWYTKAPAGDWKPPMAGTTSNNGMGLVALLAIVLLANMTSLLFCLFLSLIHI